MRSTSACYLLTYLLYNNVLDGDDDDDDDDDDGEIRNILTSSDLWSTPQARRRVGPMLRRACFGFCLIVNEMLKAV